MTVIHCDSSNRFFDVLNAEHRQSMPVTEQIRQFEYLRDRAEDHIRGLTIPCDQLSLLGRANSSLLGESHLQITAPQNDVTQYLALVRLTAHINGRLHDLY